MKLLSRLVIALVICLLAIPMMATPVQAAGITLKPRYGNVGQKVYVSGTFDGYTDHHVYIYYEVAEDEWELVDDDYTESDGSLYTYFNVPESCSGEHEIRVCYKKDERSTYRIGYKDFTVEPKVEITRPTGAKGPMGTEVKVKGTGFGEDEEEIEILFDGDVVSGEEFEADEYGTWEGTFLVPAASKGKHDVSAEGDYTDEYDVEEATFTVGPGISLEIKTGSPGDTITVTGSGFEEDETRIKILFDGDVVSEEQFEADDDGCWEETFEVPQAAMGTYDVTAEGRYTDKEDIEEVEFEVVPGITLSPTKGYVGQVLTVSGSGFPAGEAVTVTYDGVEKGSATADTNGVLPDITFAATHTQSEHKVKHPVAATYDTTTVPAENFIMESDAPAKPILTLPANDSRVGLFRKQTPTFEWSEVTDDSGVTYNLEIGTSADFTPVLISRTGLTEASYTLTGAEALDYGTYYWRVKAIDGALNDSGWSIAYSFKSCLLPFWASIVIAALIVALIGSLVYFLVRRRRAFYG